MKKLYIAPELTIVSTMCQNAILGLSGGTDGLGSSAPESGGEYKPNSGVTVGVKGQGGYDVWDDDWSK